MKKILLLLLFLPFVYSAPPNFFPLEGYVFDSLNNQISLNTFVSITNNNISYETSTYTFGPPGFTGYYSTNNLLGSENDNITVLSYNESHYGFNTGLLKSLFDGITKINVSIDTLRNSELNISILSPDNLDHITPDSNFSLNVYVDNVGWQAGTNCFINLSIDDESVINSSVQSVFYSSIIRNSPFVINYNMSALSYGSVNISVIGVCDSDNYYIENSFNDNIFLYVDSSPPSLHPVEGYVFNSDLSMASTGVTVTITSLITGDVKVVQTFGPPGFTGYYSTNNLLAFDGEEVSVVAQSGLVLGQNNGNILSLAEGITKINVTMNQSSGVSINNITFDDSIISPVDEIILSPNSFVNLSCNATIQNGGGSSELNIVNATIYHHISGNDGILDNNSLYKNTSCSFVSGFGDYSNYTCGFSVAYYANNGTWTCELYTQTNTFQEDVAYDNNTVLPLFSFDLNASILDYGNITPGAESGELSINISNSGNMNFSLYLFGYGGFDNNTGFGNSFNCVDNNISVNYHRYDFSSSTPYASKNFLSSTSTFSSLILSKQINSSISSSNLFWQMSVPELDPVIGVGQCNGTVVFEAFS